MQPTTTTNSIAVSDWRDYFDLLKPRVMSLVVFTALCGLLAAPGHIGFVLGFTAIPSMAVMVHRLHDQNKSGWLALWLLIPVLGTIIMIIFMCARGTVGSNQYGDDPILQTH